MKKNAEVRVPSYLPTPQALFAGRLYFAGNYRTAISGCRVSGLIFGFVLFVPLYIYCARYIQIPLRFLNNLRHNMSGKREKKRKSNAEVFDLDRIISTVKSNELNVQSIREHVKALRDIDLHRMLMEKVKLTEEKALILVSCRVGAEGLMFLKEALKHVPENITRIENGKSMRFTFVCKIFRALASNRGSASNLKDEEIELLCSFLESYCSEYLNVPTLTTACQSIWSLTQDEGTYFNSFLTPPVMNCLDCEKLLTMHNKPSKATLFTLEGPVPCTKVTLECRDCSVHYGITKFFRSCELGSRFYPNEFPIDVIEVSNVTYINRKLYDWMPSLR